MNDEPAGMIWMGGQPTAPRRRRRYLLLAALAVLVLGVGAAVAGILTARGDYATATPTPSSTLGSTMNVRGGVALAKFDYAIVGGACVGRGGFDDIAPGAQVKITDRGGALIGLGSITQGVVVDSDNGKTKDACLLLWTVDDVPRFQQFYGVEVSHRGIVQATEAQLIGGEFTLSLG